MLPFVLLKTHVTKKVVGTIKRKFMIVESAKLQERMYVKTKKVKGETALVGLVIIS